MSLPSAPKDISDHPKSGSVVDPVIKADKDADVDRKIRLYGVIEAFRQGRMPDNIQVDETLHYVLKDSSSPVNVDQLSPDGHKLIQDAKDIIETARIMVKEKNADELFQNFVWHTRDVDLDFSGKGGKKGPNEVLKVDKEQAKDDGRMAVQHLRTILSLVLTNSEVRKLLSDFSLIGRDLLARGASKAASALRPDPVSLARVDDSTRQDQFVEDDGKGLGSNGMKEGVNGAVAHDGKGLGSRERLNGMKEGVNGEVAHDDKEQINGNTTEEDTTQADAKKRNLIDRFIPQKHKENATDQFHRGKHFLMEEYFPEERRDQFIFRGKKVIIECQKHDDYQESIKWLLSYAEEYAQHGKTIAGHGKERSAAITSDAALQTATSELRTLLERFANGKSMSIIFDAANVLIDDANKNEDLREWFKSLNAYVRKVLLQPGYVIEPACSTEGTHIRESGQKFYDGQYKSHFDDLFTTVGDWFKAMGEDPLNKRFGEDWARLTRDLLFDSEGSLKFKPDLWNDVRRVIVPTLVDKIGYIPIPRIEYTDDTLDLVVENLTMSGRNLFPNVVTLEAHNYVKFSPYSAIKDEHHHEFTLTFGQMQADMRDVAIYFRKKTGIKMTDSGLADVVLGGEGLTATVHLVSADKDKTSVFKVKNVIVKVDSLKFSIRDSKHDFLYKTLKPLATTLVKKQIQKAIRSSITTGLEYVDGQLVGVRDRMADVKATEGESRNKVLQDLFAKKKDESVKQSTSSARNSLIKVVHNKRNSILDTGHPAGWVNRTTEREEAALKGRDWHSEAFLIV